MTIYVQSRGESQDHDYCWLEVSKNGEPEIIIPPGLEKIRSGQLIDNQKPSLILARSDRYLILLLAALESQNRTDFVGRRIRNSVVWVEIDSPENEQNLRKITIQALEGNLASIVNQAVDSDSTSKYGFRVDYQELIKAVEGKSSKLDIQCNKVEHPTLKLGGNNKHLKLDLASELKEYTLPTKEDSIQILIVVTTLKSQKGLEEQRVWRGLSSRIESEEWIESEYQSTSSIKEGAKNSPKKHHPRASLITILIVSIITLAMWILIHHRPPKTPKSESLSRMEATICPEAIVRITNKKAEEEPQVMINIEGCQEAAQASPQIN
jgi:hypothetical protein